MLMSNLFRTLTFISLASLSSPVCAETNATTEELQTEAVSNAPDAIEISTPEGWSRSEGSGMSIVMMEPKKKARSKKAASYQRNITVAQSHNPSPIDETSRLEFNERLVKSFGEKNGLEDFQVIDSEILEYQEGKTGILAYTSYVSNKAQLMQMHLLVSGSDSQFLITYTDLASRFSPQDKGFDLAWNSMTTVSVQGEPPLRYKDIAVLSGIAGAFLFLMLMFAVMRRRRFKRMYQADSYIMEDTTRDEPLTGLDEFSFDNDVSKTHVSQMNTATATSSVWNI